MSNFQIVESLFGQKDEKGFQNSAPMCAILAEIKGQKLDKKQKPYSTCTLIDDTGVKHDATIRPGSKGLPPITLLGKRCLFSLQPYQGQSGINFSGFCNGIAADKPQAQQSTPAGKCNNDIVLIVRQCAFKGAIELACAGKINIEDIMVNTLMFADDIMAGKVIEPPDEQPAPQDDGRQAEDDGIPF